MANKVYAINKDIPHLGLVKGQRAKLSEETAEAHGLKEDKPKANAPKVEQGVVDAD